MTAPATDEAVEAALFARLLTLKKHPPAATPPTPPGPFVHVDRYGGEWTPAGVDERLGGRFPGVLLAFEGAAPTGGEDGAEVDTILHDVEQDRKSTRLNSSHLKLSRMPSSA